MTENFPCGHPRKDPHLAVETRTRTDGTVRTYKRCRTCRNARTRAYRETRVAKDRLAVLRREREALAKSRAQRAPGPGSSKYAQIVDLEPMGNWVERGICAIPGLYDPNMWHDRPLSAVSVCYGCPVMFECAQYAVDNKIEHGVWGGLTPSDRGHARGRP